MIRIVISGGAGFIGSHLCEYFLNTGNQVTAIDNFLTSSPSNIESFSNNSNFKFIEADISELNSFQIEGDIDCLLHFASPASPKDFQKLSLEIMKVGAFGTYQMLELATMKKATFILASTSEVYGDPDSQNHPQREEYWGNVNPIGLRSVYDEAKRYAEALTMAYHRKYQIDTRIIRIFNTFGPRMLLDDGRVVPTFIKQALNNKPITVYGDGSQTRSFCYVEDLIRGISKVLEKYKSPYPINLGNPEEMTIINFANRIKELCQSSSLIEYRPLPENDPSLRRPDISKAIKELNWQPEVSLDEGLSRTIKWFKARIK